MSQSSRGILERLSDHLEQVAANLSKSIHEASDKHAGTPEAVSADREQSLRQVIRRFFPDPFKVTKGAIYDSYGGRSASIDCVVCAPNHPYLVGGDDNIEIILIDGVFAALELKPVLTDLPLNFGRDRKQTPEVLRGLEQIRSLKKLQRTESSLLTFPQPPSNEKKDYSLRCPSYIIANTCAHIKDLAKYIADYYVEQDVPPTEQVDVVFALQGGLILSSKYPDNGFTQMSGMWRPHMAAYEPSPATTALFFLRLVGDIGPELPISIPVLQRYLAKMTRPDPVAGFFTSVVQQPPSDH